MLSIGQTSGQVTIYAPGPPDDERLIGHDGPVVDLTFSADGARLFTLSWDGTIGIWSLGRSELVKRIGGLGEVPRHLIGVPATDRVWVAAPHEPARLLDLSEASIERAGDLERLALAVHPTWMSRNVQDYPIAAAQTTPVPRLSTDGRLLALVSARDQVTVLQAATGEVEATIDVPGATGVDASISPSGRRLSTLSNRRLGFWQLPEAELLWEIACRPPCASPSDWSSDETLLLAGTDLIDSNHGELVRRLDDGSRFKRARGSFYRDGRLVLLRQFGRATLYELPDGTARSSIRRNEDLHISELMPDGRRLLIGGPNDLAIYDLDGRELFRFELEPDELLNNARISPDGRTIALAINDEVRLFRAPGA